MSICHRIKKRITPERRREGEIINGHKSGGLLERLIIHISMIKNMFPYYRSLKVIYSHWTDYMHVTFCTQGVVLQWNAEELTSVDSGQCVFKKYEQLWFKGSWKQLTTPRKCLPWLTSSPAWWRRSCLGGILSAPDPDLLISLLNSSQLLRDLLKSRCPWRYLHILSIFFLVTCIQGSAREISIVVHSWYTWIKSAG